MSTGMVTVMVESTQLVLVLQVSNTCGRWNGCVSLTSWNASLFETVVPGCASIYLEHADR